MNHSENINIPSDKSDIPTSKNNLLHGGIYDKHLLSSSDYLNNKNDEKEKKISIKNNKNNENSGSSSKKNKKTKGELDTYSVNKSLLLLEEKISEEDKKVQKKVKKEKRYIVDNLDNILSKLSEPKLKLLIQEILLYAIVFLVCLYYWIFLIISTSKLERNYCFNSINQFDSCSKEEICAGYKNKLNIILYNNTFNYNNYSLNSIHDKFIEEIKIINTYYRPFFIRYSHLLTANKMFAKIQMTTISDKTNYAIVLTHKENWNLFLRYFSMCEYENYYIIFLIMISLGGVIGSLLFGFLSDIYGRRTIIRTTLLISTISTISLYILTFFFDKYYILY